MNVGKATNVCASDIFRGCLVHEASQGAEHMDVVGSIEAVFLYRVFEVLDVHAYLCSVAR